ncbi:MAG: long-chain-fatty-acid--CoA ligase [Acidimicrobiaceae bacterium]|nr:long-chain-fatty-acid--CoA ligase [Acidimicrobiaceae bacterium]
MTSLPSTMQVAPLTVRDIVHHAERVYPDRHVFTVERDGVTETTFTEVVARARRLARALEGLGVSRGERVATLMWNNQAHLEAYIAVPTMGAVLHTLNLRLFPDQLAFVINDAEDAVILVDASVLGLLARIRPRINPRHIVVRGTPEDTYGLDLLDYEELLASVDDAYLWPDLDESEPAIACYTSGTTGDPKGVVYSHRSLWLHSLAIQTKNSIALGESDRALLVVPMFHVNAWGMPYGALWCGADLVMPQMFLQGEPLARMINDLRPTVALGVPTIWMDLLRAAESGEYDLSSLRVLVAGGAAVSATLIRAYRDRLGLAMLQGWGMTETSPLVAVAIPPAGASGDEEIYYRAKTGRLVAGVEIRVVGESGEVLDHDGASVGEFELRGPWIASGYIKGRDPESFHDGWLRTGDIGTVDAHGFIVISDRRKDVIKSGGEWISSVELENLVMAHPSVHQAAVVAIPHERWQERPLCLVVLREGHSLDVVALREHLGPHVASWWVPEYWATLEEMPLTSVGKFDKRELRRRHAAGEIEIHGV